MLQVIKQYGAHRLILTVLILEMYGRLSFEKEIYSDRELEFDEPIDCSEQEKDMLILACSLV